MDRGRREADEGACFPTHANALNRPQTGEAQGLLFQRYKSEIDSSVLMFPKVPKDEGASRTDGDQETCQQNDFCRGRYRICPDGNAKRVQYKPMHVLMQIEDDAYQEDLGFSLGQLGKSGSGRVRQAQVNDATKARISKSLQVKSARFPPDVIHSYYFGGVTPVCRVFHISERCRSRA